MMVRGSILAAGAALLLSSAGVQAADLPGMRGGSIKDGYAMQEPQRSTSWYVRGDAARAFQDVGSMEELPAYTHSPVHIGNTHSFGLGLGYHFARNVRGDLTFDWRKEDTIAGYIGDTSATVQGERAFGIKNSLFLANLYYDFETRAKITPYVGVGLGFARNTTTAGIVNITGCSAGTCSADFEGASKTNAAGAFMAGFSTRLHDRISLDAGYRFLYLGDAHTGQINITRTPPVVGAPNSIGAIKVNDLTAHELRVGLRVDLR